ncbi:Transient receptor potential-gamma protein-like 1 [Homarus americanus]|uniref:Transient receptor potential-gamma protein-like 1 n=1 Tax=Homarus americanus TaxID=6706 RepID=A0A8J5NAG0_HOMAM|nr:Transient receptor potential-gamma protein-like 1 [Homarus americanus]
MKERADTEWKFARSKLWISFFEEGGTCPPPFNTIPTPKSLYYLLHWFYKKFCGQTKAAKKEHMRTIRSIMRNLVRRYVTVEQRKAENQGVTEDDVNEIKQDISAFRCELVEILKISGMNTSTATTSGQGIHPRGSSGGKKNRQKERRLMKGFNLGVNTLSTTQSLGATTVLPATAEVRAGSQKKVVEVAVKRSPQNKLARLARLAEARLGRPTNKKRWGTLVEAAKNAKVKKLLSRSRSDESLSSEPGNEITGNSEDALGGGGETPTPLQNLPPGILRGPDGSSEATRQERTGSGVSGTMHLDAAALVSQHEPVKRPPKSSVSFDQSALAGASSSSPSHSSTETEPPPPYPQWPRPVSTSSNVTEPTVTAASPSSGSGSLPPLAVSESSEPLVGAGPPANGSVQPPRLPGIQPVNRHMAAGWL